MPHNHAGCMSPRDYFTEQLLTVLVCGALGVVSVQLYLTDRLKHILAPQFHTPVLVGGAVVLALVVLRAVAVWREAGALVPADDAGGPACGENHVHTAACNHLPGLPGAPNPDEDLVDDHGHSHDMSWVFARMLVLVFPVALFLLGLPNAGLSPQAQAKLLGADAALDAGALKDLAKTAAVEKTEQLPDGSTVRTLRTESGLQLREVTPTGGGEPTYSVIAQAGTEMRFNDLTEAALNEDKRKSYAGTTAILEGRFQRIGDKEFTLFRQKMTCCGADAVMLKVRIISPTSVGDRRYFEWVRVKGVIEFLKPPGQNRYVPVLRLADVTDVTPIPENQIKNQYEF